MYLIYIFDTFKIIETQKLIKMECLSVILTYIFIKTHLRPYKQKGKIIYWDKLEDNENNLGIHEL